MLTGPASAPVLLAVGLFTILKEIVATEYRDNIKRRNTMNRITTFNASDVTASKAENEKSTRWK
jgi:hypothetical protein